MALADGRVVRALPAELQAIAIEISGARVGRRGAQQPLETQAPIEMMAQPSFRTQQQASAKSGGAAPVAPASGSFRGSGRPTCFFRH